MDVKLRERIVSDPGLRGGQPCIRGTRVPVSLIVATLADWPVERLLAEYPQLTNNDIQAALHFAAEAADHTLVA
jgi:uncharacterized protein (DUF433 family)